MNFFTDHPGFIYFSVTIGQAVLTAIIAGALVSIALSLKRISNKSKDKI